LRINRVSVLATAVLLSLGLTTACGVIGPQADKSTVVIGADLELSGADAAIGVVYKQALDLEISQINAAGGAGGHPLRLDALDNHSDPHVSATNVATLAEESGLAAIVTGVCPDCLNAVQETLNAKKIPTISLAAANLTQSLPYIFKLNPNSVDDADQLVSEMQSDENNPVRKYAVLTTNDAYGDSLTQAIMAQAGKSVENDKGQETRKGATAVSAQFKSTDTGSSLRTVVTQAVSKDPEALLISALPSQAVDVAVAARDADFKGPMYFDAVAAGNLFQPTNLRAVDGVRMVAPQSLVIDDVIATSPAQTSRKQWLNAYTSSYANFSAYSLYAADAVHVIATAIGSAGGTDRDRLRSIIEGTQMDGFSGPLRFTPDNHSGLTPQALTTVVVDNGRWHLATG
jgi:branched-chain amino acid transport system substrate-binding protein